MVLYRRPQPDPGSLTLTFKAQCNGSIQLTGIIPEGYRANVRYAMKNSRYDFIINDDTGKLCIHIKRTVGKTCPEQLEIIRQCAEKLGERTGIAVRITNPDQKK